MPLDTKIAFLMKLNEAALAVPGVSFVSSQVLFVDEQKYFASSEGSRITQRLVRTYPQFSTTAADRASGDFQTRAVVDRAQLVGYEYVEDYPWLRDAEKAGHEVVEKLKAKPVAPGRYDLVVDPSQLFLAIHESVGHSTELDRSLGWEANMAGTSFLKASDAGKLRFGAHDRQPGRRPHPAGRPGDHRLRRRGREGRALAPGARRHVRRLADDARAGAARRPAALAWLPALGQLVERAVPADAERLARSRPRTEVTLDDLFSDIKRGLFIEGRGSLVDRPAALQLPVRRRRHPRDHQRQARRDGQGRGVSVAHARLLGVVRRPRRPGHLSAVGHVGRRQGRARPDQRGQPRLSAGAVPPGHRPEHGGRLMLTRDEALTICETVLAHAKAAGAEDAVVSLQNAVEAHARFADNRITTSGRSEDLDITATVWVGRRRGVDHRQRHERRRARSGMADDAVQIARVSPVHREYVPTLGPLDYPEARGFADATAEVDVTARAAGPRGRAAAPAATPRSPAPASTRARASAIAAATANGNRRYFRSSEAGLSVTARSGDGTGSGYYAGDHFDVARLDDAAHRRRRRSTRRCARATRSRSSPAPTR